MNAIFSTGRVSLIQSYLKDRVTIRQNVFSLRTTKHEPLSVTKELSYPLTNIMFRADWLDKTDRQG